MRGRRRNQKADALAKSVKQMESTLVRERRLPLADRPANGSRVHLHVQSSLPRRRGRHDLRPGLGAPATAADRRTVHTRDADAANADEPAVAAADGRDDAAAVDDASTAAVTTALAPALAAPALVAAAQLAQPARSAGRGVAAVDAAAEDRHGAGGGRAGGHRGAGEAAPDRAGEPGLLQAGLDQLPSAAQARHRAAHPAGDPDRGDRQRRRGRRAVPDLLRPLLPSHLPPRRGLSHADGRRRAIAVPLHDQCVEHPPPS